MGPKPPKKLTFKTYSVPRNKHFIFIQNPWPFGTSIFAARSQQAQVNAIVGWVCCMVNDLCDAAIEPVDVVIYAQSTHREVIAEVEIDSEPGEFKLEPLLGAHESVRFLRKEHEDPRNNTSVIFEYNYARANAPGRTNWTSFTATASHKKLLNFPIKHEGMDGGQFAYPTPGPAGIKRPQVAKPLPGRLRLGDPECTPQLPEPMAAPAPRAVATLPPPLQPQPPHAAPVTGTPTPDAQPRHPTPEPEPEPGPAPAPRSELAFTPYQPLVIAAARRQESTPQPQPQVAAPMEVQVKREPKAEEEEGSLQDLWERVVATEEARKREAQAQAQAERENGIRVKAERVDSDTPLDIAAERRVVHEDVETPRVKAEPEELVVPMQVDGDAAGIWKAAEDALMEQGMATMAERKRDAEAERVGREDGVRVKDEPVDVPMAAAIPPPPPTNSRSEAQPAVSSIPAPPEPSPMRSIPKIKSEPTDAHMSQAPHLAPAPVIRKEEDAPGMPVINPDPPTVRSYFDSFESEIDTEPWEPSGPPVAPPATRKRFDPFAAFESEPAVVKSEEKHNNSFNTRRVKQEEQAHHRSPYTGRESRTYSPGIRLQRNMYARREEPPQRWDRGYRPQPQPPSAFPQYQPQSQPQPPSAFPRSPHPSFREPQYSARGGDYRREASGTFSPSPHPVKRERDSYQDEYLQSNREEPRIKRERVEDGPQIQVKPYSNSNLRDPRVRARIEREERERGEAAKRVRME
ncbi:hypothetical protein C8R46DRAFT_1361247 [Mycena filopes]|nr:hypothetical protein C8R46DRAFT_1361247 [Mycena filopes]